MSITSKLDYLKTTKEMIRTSLNNIGADLSSSATFRSYAAFIDTIYESLPKGTASGSIFTISNTKAGKMSVSLYGGPMYQISGTDPSPSVSKKLWITTGNNSIVICGKNMFDKNNAHILDKCMISNGELTYNDYRKVFYFRCKPSTTYTISKAAYSQAISGAFAVGETEWFDPTDYYGTSVYYTTSSPAASKITFTTSSQCEYLIVQFFNSNNSQYTLQQMLDSIQVEYGDTNTTYEAFKGNTYPVNLGTLQVRGIGNLADYIYKSGNNWYIHRTILSQSPTSSYNFVKNNTQPISLCTLFYYDNANAYNDGNSMSTTVYAMSTMFKGIGYRDMTFNDGSTQYAICLQCDNASNHRIWIRVPSSVADDTTALKTFIDTYQPTLYFVGVDASQSYDRIRDNDLIAQLEVIQNAMSQSGTTNILQYNDEVPFKLSVSYLEGDES